MDKKFFILSPATTGGKKAQMLLRNDANFDLAIRLRTDGAPIAEVFSFMSSLYFRGKVAYAKQFGSIVGGSQGHVITANQGLIPMDTIITLKDIEGYGSIPIQVDDPRYYQPLKATAITLKKMIDPTIQVVLLGSIATDKYAEILLRVFGKNIYFPIEFLSRGDMSRGGLMLKAVRTNTELGYGSLLGYQNATAPRRPRAERISLG